MKVVILEKLQNAVETILGASETILKEDIYEKAWDIWFNRRFHTDNRNRWSMAYLDSHCIFEKQPLKARENSRVFYGRRD